ncbi:hypothetical protein GCM10023175_02290 [Pseudonocardia xishanensis]|uniref:Uncharacterized protein n=1 Tax=Pseudonocardia xishanensis TaxID=630995 RepID=A0ABP8RE42_9PSEU
MEADRRCSEPGADDWYAAAVVTTCMWLADATYAPPWGRPHPARSPATDRELRAYPETIEGELVAAAILLQHRPDLVRSRPGWAEGISATLRWAWHAGPPPLPGVRATESSQT